MIFRVMLGVVRVMVGVGVVVGYRLIDNELLVAKVVSVGLLIMNYQ